MVAELPMLRELTPEQRSRVCRGAQFFELRAGETVWDRGDAADQFTFLVSGQVRLKVQQSRRREFLIDLIDEPGGLLCVPAVCGTAPHCCAAVCSRTTKLLSVPRTSMLGEAPAGLGEARAGVPDVLLSELSHRAMGLCRRLREVGGSKVEQRVAAVLLRLADERGKSVRDGVELQATISRGDLAGLCGCATETLIRVLTNFEERELVRRRGRALIIDTERLFAFLHEL